MCLSHLLFLSVLPQIFEAVHLFLGVLHYFHDGRLSAAGDRHDTRVN